MIDHPSVERDAWERGEHTHCRCGARALPMLPPWPGSLCAACGHITHDCPCQESRCESCGVGPS